MKGTYETTDFNTAAILIYSGIQLEDIDKSDVKRAKFIFKNIGGLKEVLDEYWEKKLLIEPIKFSMIQKEIKSRLYNS